MLFFLSIAMGTGCVEIFLDYLKDSLDTLFSVLKYAGPGKGSFNYGEWTKIQGKITFNEAELDPSNVFLSLRIAGKGKLYSILRRRGCNIFPSYMPNSI
jgi:hypothetical protein